ncbi:hypothetical protein BLOT_016005, partial [Blomia tropicalis]
IIYLICCCICLMLESSLALQSETIRGHPCVKRNRQIYCPLPGSKHSNLYRATRSNSSLSQGPAMYYHRFTSISESTTTTTTTTSSPIGISKSNTHVIYYTKQYDEATNGPNTFDLNDEDEHEFMHQTNVEENVIDHGDTQRTLKSGRMNAFIEENKALIRRMFGDYHTQSDWFHPETREHFSSFHDGPDRKVKRAKRSIGPSPLTNNKVDSCQSSVEIVTPYWASNSGGKIRAIVNTQHLQQAIQQEVCQAVQTKHCNQDCTCEQKYKWHRLLAYDPDDDCKGIFMDWFLFPSCCICRCKKY